MAEAHGTIEIMAGDYVTTGAAATALGVSSVTLLEWEKQGIVTPAMRTAGGQRRWRLDELRQQVAEAERKRRERRSES